MPAGEGLVVIAQLEDLRSRLAQGDTLIGTFLNLGSSVASEIAGLAGFDWVIIDLEHGSGSEATLVSQLQALESFGVVPIVRVEDNARPRFSFALDRGAGGVMVPRVDTAEEARRAVSFLRYPPDGIRGVAGLNRACSFGLTTRDIIPAFNDLVLGVMQIETVGAVDEVERIAAVDGVDVLFVGPMDLSHSMGIPGDLEHPKFDAAVRRISMAAAAAGKATGIHVSSIAAAERFAERGFGLVALGSDSSFMLGAMTEVVVAAKHWGGGE